MAKKVLHVRNNNRMVMNSPHSIVVLALGSNLGNRMLNIKRAIQKIPLKCAVFASFYETEALLPDKHLSNWDRKFLNTIVCGYSSFTPREFLQKIKQIEYKLGRKNGLRWSPRLIDIDIIFYKYMNINTSLLTIPHKEFHKRNFVTIPLQELLKYHAFFFKNILMPFTK